MLRRAIATIVPIALATPPAMADEKAACADAYGKAQTLRDAHQLTAARDQLRICARPGCTHFIAKDCTAWLAELEERLPSVVFSAADSRGGDVVDATVTMDGQVIATKLDGRSIDVDPGQHTFDFSTSDGRHVQRTVVIVEGQRTQRVTATLPEVRGVAPGASSGGTPDVSSGETPPVQVSSWSGRKTMALVVGGAGVVGLGVGTFFGLSAISSWNTAQNECPAAGCKQHAQAQTDHDNAASSALVSTIAFAAGGALVAAGAVLFLTAPSSREQAAHASTLSAAPLVGPGTAGLSMQGSF